MTTQEKTNSSVQFNYDQTFAFMKIVSILSDSSEFVSWLKKFHGLNNYDDLLEGYRLILLTALKCFIHSILISDPFKLKDDRILARADFRGITLENIPNTCEKTLFIKNVWKLSKDIRRAQKWDEFNSPNSFNYLTKFFDNILNNYLDSTTDLTIKDSLIAVSKFYSYIYLIDTSHGGPKGALTSIFEQIKNHVYLEKSFTGYAYALQFLWYNLMNEDEFKNSCLKDLHRSTEIHFKDDEGVKISIPLGEVMEFNEIPESESEKKENLERKVVYNKWYSIDQFFNKVRSEIIRPMESHFHIVLGGIEGGLLNIRRTKTSLKFLLSNDVDDASFVGKDDKESVEKQLDCDLLWYPINVLDSAKSFSFNGAFAFVSLLTGYVQMLDEVKSEGRILVKVFKHPVTGVNGYDYSFGILMGVHGFFSDSSGWLIFLDCATDYSGQGGEDYKLCKRVIDKHDVNDKVEVQEQVVDNNIFKEFLAEKNVLTIEKDNFSEIYRHASSIISKTKGKFFEYVLYKWISDNSNYNTIKCDSVINNEQIDCYCIIDNKIEIFECKMQVHDEIHSIVKQVNNKIKALKSEFPQHEVLPSLIVYESITEERKIKLENEGIKIMHNFRNNGINDRTFDGVRREILQILDGELHDKWKY